MIDCAAAGVGKRTLNKDRIKNFHISRFSESTQKKSIQVLEPSVNKIAQQENEIIIEKNKIINFFKSLDKN